MPNGLFRATKLGLEPDYYAYTKVIALAYNKSQA